MSKKNSLPFFILFVCCSFGFTTDGLPDPPLELSDYLKIYQGAWKGVITQESKRKTRYFDMDMSLSIVSMEDSTLSLNTHVIDGDNHAYMAGYAKITPTGDLLMVEEEIIRSDTIQNMEWCLKKIYLRRKTEDEMLHLKGVWSGEVSFGACLPGSLDLVQHVYEP